METKNNYIDELVRNSLSCTEQSSDDAALWCRIDNTMKYKRFLKFSLNTFNIYYSVVLLLIIISATAYFFINNNSQNTSPVKNNNSIQLAPSTNNNVPTELKSDKTDKPSVSSVQPAIEQNLQDNSTKKINGKTSPVIKNEQKNATTTENTESKTDKKTKKIKVVKKQFIVTDTILKKDTVVIKK